MAKKNNFQTIPLKPLTGILDLRSDVDQLPAGAMRWKLNYGINPDGKLSRALGWNRPFLSFCDYKNWDWHNQGVPTASREPITLLFQSTENDGERRLFMATKTKIGRLNEASGSWTILGSGFGADGGDSLTQTRFHAAELQNNVYFTNDVDVPMYHDLGTDTVQAIGGLSTAGEAGGALSKARVIIAWSGLVILANVVEDGIRYASRFRWSDLNDGTAWDVSDAASVTDFQDLDYGEEILAAIPLAGALYIFTDKSIWRCTPSIDLAAPSLDFSCIKIYTEPRNRAKCLAYPNAIISTGFEIYYAASDGIYKYDPYMAQPERTEWIHRATSVIYNDSISVNGASTKIDKQACESPIMEYIPGPNENETAGSGEIHISWPTYDPLATEVGGPSSDGIDCDTYVPTPSPVGSGLNRHTLVLNLKNSTADYRDYGSTAMVNFTSQLLAGDCAQQAMFLAANGQDYAIKLMNQGYSREYYDPDSDTFTTYGYFSTLRFIFPFEKFDADKIISGFAADVIPADENDTAVMSLRIGVADRALDPNKVNGRCQVLWHQLSNVPIKCSYSRTATKYVTDGVRPDLLPVSWAFFYRGKFLMVELTVKSSSGTSPKTGGLSISRFEVDAKSA